jgi:hypothetical protein
MALRPDGELFLALALGLEALPNGSREELQGRVGGAEDGAEQLVWGFLAQSSTRAARKAARVSLSRVWAG